MRVLAVHSDWRTGWQLTASPKNADTTVTGTEHDGLHPYRVCGASRVEYATTPLGELDHLLAMNDWGRDTAGIWVREKVASRAR